MRLSTITTCRRVAYWSAILATVFGGCAWPQADSSTLVNAPQVVDFLNQTIDWYRQRTLEPQLVSETADQLLVTENRQTADQIVRLAFDFSRGAAALQPKPDRANPGSGGAAAEFPSLLQLQTRLEKELQDAQAELAADRQHLVGATGAPRRALEGQILELPGEIDLLNARREAVRNMVEFLNGSSANGQGGTGLRAQIETLAATVSVTASGSANAEGSSAAAVAAAASSAGAMRPAGMVVPASLWDATGAVIDLARKKRSLGLLIDRAGTLAQLNHDISAPFVGELKVLSAQGDQLAAQADAASSAQLAAERVQLDALAVRFKQLSAVVTPLGKQAILLRLYQGNLRAWDADLQENYRAALRALGVRASVLALILAAVMAASALWKRAVFRYVHDAQRRHQFLFLRRVVLLALIALIVAFAFAGQLGSFATFAGLLTAGVAVALQNVILAVVGYFFLIGKYGIRVGDRVQIGGVTGEVLDIGLVRLHLLELAGGADGPTGRVVAFSNSIIFQSTAGLYKNLSGVHLAWHEMTVMLATDCDHGTARTRLLQATEAVLEGYREEIERQSHELGKAAGSVSRPELKANIRLRLLASGVEATVYYPVDTPHATEIDERVAQALLKELQREPQLRLAGAGAGSGDMRIRTAASEPK